MPDRTRRREEFSDLRGAMGRRQTFGGASHPRVRARTVLRIKNNEPAARLLPLMPSPARPEFATPFALLRGALS
jgi:hypothetical protein